MSAPVPARQPHLARPVDPLTLQQMQREHVLVTVSSSPAAAAHPYTPTWTGTCCLRQGGSRWSHGLRGTTPGTQQTGLRAAYLQGRGQGQGQGQGQDWQSAEAAVPHWWLQNTHRPIMVLEVLVAPERVRGEQYNVANVGGRAVQQAVGQSQPRASKVSYLCSDEVSVIDYIDDVTAPHMATSWKRGCLHTSSYSQCPLSAHRGHRLVRCSPSRVARPHSPVH